MTEMEMVPPGIDRRADRTRVDALRVLRYSDLVGLGIVNNRMTLHRWVTAGDFPRPLKLGANSVAWRATDVAEWLERRAAEREAHGRLAARDSTQARP